jgi:hypothetical protein
MTAKGIGYKVNYNGNTTVLRPSIPEGKKFDKATGELLFSTGLGFRWDTAKTAYVARTHVDGASIKAVMSKAGIVSRRGFPGYNSPAKSVTASPAKDSTLANAIASLTRDELIVLLASALAK